MSVEIEVLEDPARACAAMLVGAAANHGNVVLAGGSTPRKAYEEFVRVVRQVGVDLDGTTIWFGDERCVGPEDDRSNYRMVVQALIAPLSDATQPAVRRMRGELGPVGAAEEYELALRSAGPPRFDLVLLGIGPDGHTASLFPGQASLDERERLVVGVEHAGLEPYVPRVTMTLPALAAAEQVVFLASGESKADAVAAAFGAAARPDRSVPSSLLSPMANMIKVLLDPAAASKL